MIDIHTHIIPYVDDGADDWATALALLQQGEKDGIKAAVATPHILSEIDYRLEPEIIKNFKELKVRAEDAGIKMKLYLGCEIYVQPDMTLEHTLSTLNQTGKYFLTEFPMNAIPRFVAEKFFELIIADKVPIVAHPERNIGFMSKPMIAYEFVQRGALMQVNAPSLLGKHGEKARQLAFTLIEHNLVHFLGSDCHRPSHRSMGLREAYKVIVDNWGTETAKNICFENARKMLNGESIEIPEPIPIEEMEKPSIWKRVRTFVNGR
ncbi:hypothetical protein JW960_05000 [candidate division KSB1 bacterium]|nr:hypothetical protein [candidate division KSB1 bacterium]